MSGVRVVFFDAVGTLLRLRKSAAFHYCEVAKRHGQEVPCEVMDKAFRTAWKETLPPITTRDRRADDDKGWWQDLVENVLNRCRIPDTAAFDCCAYFEELYREFEKPGVWELYPETTAVLESLATRFELGIISNFDGRLHTVLAELGIGSVFRHVVISSEVGADKPDGWIFEEALRRSGVSASEALHVGDDPVADWEGAAGAGMQVFELDRPALSLNDVVKQLLPVQGAR